MSRQEFLDTLRRALSGSLSSSLVAENMAYYNEYISSEMRKGRSEEEVMAALGDPRLIARTIIETSGGEDAGSGYGRTEYQQGYGDYERGYGWTDDSGQADAYGGTQDYGQADGYGEGGYHQAGGYGRTDYDPYEKRSRSYRIPGWLWLVALILIVVLIFSLVFSVLSFLAPVLVPILVVIFLVKLFRDWLN